MYAVILAGGSGSRLWPLSREEFPKQYLPLGPSGESLLQETVVRVLSVVPAAQILVVTPRSQEAEVRRQLARPGLEEVTLILEPAARNTAPAVALAAWHLHAREGPAAVLAVLPSDHLIPSPEQFAALLLKGEKAARRYGLVTFGIRPEYPETGYGYIRCGAQLDADCFRVEQFVEKPDLEKARSFCQDSRYLWNSGMFAFRVDSLLAEYCRLLPEIAAALDKAGAAGGAGLEEAYRALKPVSIDYGIMERAREVAVIPAGLAWSDLGSWEAYYRVLEKDGEGNCLRGRAVAVDTRGSLILAQSRLVGTAGVENLAVIETGDALLVCAREKSQAVKELVERLKEEDVPEYRRHRSVRRPWGEFTTLEEGDSYQVKRITVHPGARLSLQSHRRRSEHWVVVRGEALVTVGVKELPLKKGQSVFIPVQARHRLENTGQEILEVIEVQNGDYLGEDDITRYEDDYGRAGAEEDCAERRYRRWLEHPAVDEATREELRRLEGDAAAIEDHFGGELVFGTGGMRGIIGPGMNRMNIYIVRRATQGLADYINRSRVEDEGVARVVIAYDTRRLSAEFAREVALVLAANGIKALLFDDIRPTPALSFATRELGCAAGIVITASHNPPQYNGYKVYGPDGGQAVPPLIDGVMEAIAAVDLFDGVKTITREEAAARGLVESAGEAVDRAYLDAIRSLSLAAPRTQLKVVYTPLHGTGACFIPELLAESGYIDLHLVEEQAAPDPDFGTVRVPNPEDPASFRLALELACAVEADLVMATDPDCDRVGCAVRDTAGAYVHLTGNQVGTLLLDYLLGRLAGRGELPANGVMIKTIVTGDLGKKVAASYGVKTVETLTGFKYIGEKIKEFEASGEYKFLFGYEESYGYLAGTFARDKDAVGACFLIAEMAAYYKERGLDLHRRLEELSQKHGYYREDLVSFELKNMAEADSLMRSFAAVPPELAGIKVVEKRDYGRGRGLDLVHGREFALTLPRSPVLYYRLADESWFCVRPSGTEPKVKLYLSVNAAGARAAGEKLARLKEALLTLP